ncbi:MAG: hypothetical protein IT204_24615 [Fimbriimonadaceae bacterium]|nr:hypothetical protein [Fimbriimonadaceae bacterium]
MQTSWWTQPANYGLLLGLAVGLFWVGFGLLDGVSEGLWGLLLHLLPGTLILVATGLAWRHPVLGGLALVLLAALTWRFYHHNFTRWAMSAPLLLAGLLQWWPRSR